MSLIRAINIVMHVQIFTISCMSFRPLVVVVFITYVTRAKQYILSHLETTLTTKLLLNKTGKLLYMCACDACMYLMSPMLCVYAL